MCDSQRLAMCVTSGHPWPTLLCLPPLLLCPILQQFATFLSVSPGHALCSGLPGNHPSPAASSREPLLRNWDGEHNVSFPRAPISSNLPFLAFQINWQSEDGEAQERPGVPLGAAEQRVPKLIRVTWATC